ncbi:hypothetical protein DUZ99_04395 [Xylanibacillus composti]|uniref:TadE-like protein n=1 Tax=Xylanibacillus composti TaxID=1572762 RepID=A0A8J4M1N8_9BACL|nr:hypothetical protein [Xylanibacillus composti]MDT9724228.1 hypothetical protein [Xylanibacillus composti]GIQ68255.1 hypothetical protein XYCOK13_10790 [Xylanibacillus composti]
MAGRIGWRRLARNEQGSFTLESSILVPVAVFSLTCFLVAGLYYYHFIVLSKTAHETVERTAFAWNHPASEWRTGVVPAEPRTSLYWRLGADGIIGIFKLLTGEIPSAIHLPHQGSEGREGPSGKLVRAAAHLPDTLQGRLHYSNTLLRRSVQAELALSLPVILRPSSEELRYSLRAASVIVEPAEFVRSVDLAVRYGRALGDRQINHQRASAAIARFIGREEPASFARHDQAAAYLRTIVGGKETEFETAHGMRRIDALDANGVVHQAYLTFTAKQLEEIQLPKDAELIQRHPEVTAVVWHFFRRTGQTGKVGPPDRLLRKLEASGITVVIHDAEE